MSSVQLNTAPLQMKANCITGMKYKQSVLQYYSLPIRTNKAKLQKAVEHNREIRE